MSSRVEMLRDEMRDVVRELDPGRFTPRDARALTQVFAELERLTGAGKTLMARRVRQTGGWAHDGDRSFEAWLARISGTGLGEAIAAAETVDRLGDLGATEQALRDGRLSRVQVNEVAAAAAADPESEQPMLHAADTRTVKDLKERGKRVIAAMRHHESDRYARIKKERHIRNWEDDDGSHLHVQSTADDIAILKTAIAAYEPAIYDAARTAGTPESHGAYQVDALVQMARDALAGGTGTTTRKRLPRAELRIRMDFGVFRGHTERGEICEIPGVGPVPVEVARKLVPDVILDLVITQGQDVRAIVTNNRTVRRAVQVALEERYPTCAKYDCDVAVHLERDHTEDFAKCRETRYEKLVPWCPHHHDLKTYHGYAPVQLPDGQWELVPPTEQTADDRAPPDAQVA